MSKILCGLLVASAAAVAAQKSAVGSASDHSATRVDYASPETFKYLANETVAAFASLGGESRATFTGTLEAQRLAPDALAVAMLSGCARESAAPFCVGEAEDLELTKRSELAPLDARGAIDFGGIDFGGNVATSLIHADARGAYAGRADLGGDDIIFVMAAFATTVLLRPLPPAAALLDGCSLRPLYGKMGNRPLPSCAAVASAARPAEACCLHGFTQKPEAGCVAAVSGRFDAALAAAGAPAMPCGGSGSMWIHASFAASGAFARDVLRAALEDSPACKVDEAMTAVWAAASAVYHSARGGTSSPAGGCDSVDAAVPLGPHGFWNYFLYKQHGGAQGWGQRFPEALVSLVLEQDADPGRRSKAHGNFCGAVLHASEGRRRASPELEWFARVMRRVRSTCAAGPRNDREARTCAAAAKLPTCRDAPSAVDIFAPLRRRPKSAA
ncbi:hypothetical protein M885DRAFT_584401 [Pelagophyceae sp. CCMP2097]|nr:hypothetical protein M885DRAFT_584401 [Pelagophyceae sp. CCMP2097]